MPTSGPDPFGINEIRDSTLQSWLTSPTRLREDVAAESDLVGVGYRDRLLTELVANAADAATAAGIVGVVKVWLDGPDLHIANTGAPLDAGGAAALTALRSSNKTGSGLVGRFGVGFTAVAAVTHHVQIRSRSGSIEFSAERTRSELQAHGIETDVVPTLRLAWPIDAGPAAGFDTEVVLRLDPHVEVETMMEGFGTEAVELLLELPAVDTIVIDGHTHVRERAGDIVAVGPDRWLEFSAPHARWLLPMTGDWLVARRRDVLRAPTRTDVELTVPAICVADVQLTADRRGLHPDADIATAAVGYADFAASLPTDQRTILVPEPGFAASRTDERLRSALLDELSTRPWLPGAGGDDLIPERAEVLVDLTAGLAHLLGEIITTLVHPGQSDRGSLTRLRSVGVTEIGLAEIASRLTGIEREPSWWGELYAELSVVAQGQVDELGALPVPLTDGRTMPGARGTVLPPPQSAESGTDVVAPSWLPTVHPEAAHELLERLGARRLSVSEMLSDPALRGEVESDPEGDDLARSVLGLLRTAPDASVPAWLGQMLLPTADGDERPADELLLPDSPLASVLVDDSPFGVVDPEWVRRYGADAFRALGVGWGFTITREEYPTGPDHDLPDEAAWWDTVGDPPQTFSAVRDLDLVHPDRWPQALSLLVESPDSAALLTDRGGYTAWWLRHYAEIGAAPLGHWRAPSDQTMAGVLDPLDHPHADELSGALGTADIEDTDQALMVLTHLADVHRSISPSVAAIAHTALATALRDGRIDLARVEPPTGLRTLAGSVADDAVVLDVPWLAAALDPADVVVLAPPGFGLAAQLADLLDIPTATEEYSGGPTEPGEASTWQAHPRALRSALIQDRALPTGPIRVHEALTVELRRGDERSKHRVPWWRDEHGMFHVDAGFDVLGG